MDRDSHPGVTILTLNRPDKLNAMTVDLVTELYDGLSAVATDRDCPRDRAHRRWTGILRRS